MQHPLSAQQLCLACFVSFVPMFPLPTRSPRGVMGVAGASAPCDFPAHKKSTNRMAPTVRVMAFLLYNRVLQDRVDLAAIHPPRSEFHAARKDPRFARKTACSSWIRECGAS